MLGLPIHYTHSCSKPRYTISIPLRTKKKRTFTKSFCIWQSEIRQDTIVLFMQISSHLLHKDAAKSQPGQVGKGFTPCLSPRTCPTYWVTGFRQCTCFISPNFVSPIERWGNKYLLENSYGVPKTGKVFGKIALSLFDSLMTEDSQLSLKNWETVVK